MLLRASGTISGQEPDLRALVDPSVAAASGIDQAPALLRFVDAAVAATDRQGAEEGALQAQAELAAAREALREAVGPAGLVDAAAVLGNFERMTRIADAIGIPLDAPTDMMSSDFRSSLGLDRFASASHTPGRGWLGRLVSTVLRPLGSALLRAFGRRRAG